MSFDWSLIQLRWSSTKAVLSLCSAAGSPLPGREGAHGTVRLPSRSSSRRPQASGLHSSPLPLPHRLPAALQTRTGTGPPWSHTPLAVLSGDVNLTTFRKHSRTAPAPGEPLCRQSPCLCFETEHTLTRTGFSGAFPGTRVLEPPPPRGFPPWAGPVASQCGLSGCTCRAEVPWPVGAAAARTDSALETLGQLQSPVLPMCPGSLRLCGVVSIS